MCRYTVNASILSFEGPRHGNKASDLLFNLHFYKCVGAVGHSELFRNFLNNAHDGMSVRNSTFKGDIIGKLSATLPQISGQAAALFKQVLII